MPEFREADRAVLVALDWWCGRQSRLQRYDWARALDVGGRAESGHSQALARLVRLGLVERRQRTDVGEYTPMRSRASWEYRITDKGSELAKAEGGTAPFLCGS
jgi:hypothetical protein